MIRKLAKRLYAKHEQRRAERERRAFIRMCVAAKFPNSDDGTYSGKVDVWRDCVQLWEAKPDDC